MSAAAFTPPMPPRRAFDLTRREPIRGTLRFLRLVARNPLEIWGEGHFEIPIIRSRFLGRDNLLLHDPEAIRHVFVKNVANYRLNDLRIAILGPFLGQGLLLAEGDHWKRTRKALTPVFTPRHVSGFGETMRRVCAARADVLATRAGETISMSEETVQLTLDILLACLFSDDTQFDAARFARDLDTSIQVSGRPHPFDALELPAWLPRFGRGKARGLRASLRRQIADVISRRRELLAAGGEGPQDFLALLLDAGEDGDGFSDGEIIDNLLTFLIAGHETTARTLGWLFYLLSQSPEWMAKVQAEIDGAALDDLPPEKWIDALPITLAVVKETMRLYPAAPALIRAAKGPDSLPDHEIKPGDQIVVSTWVLHRHYKLWRDPDMFDPERFLNGEADALGRDAYLPFGLGPRVCIGASFALQEIMIVLGSWLPKLTFTHVGTEHPSPIMKITLHPSTPIEMKIGLRG